MPDAYRIYAVRYAHRRCTSSEAFYGDHHAAPMTMDYFVWALTNGAQTVVVDLGFTEEVGTRRGSTRANRPPTRNMSSPNISRQLAGSTLWPAATASSSGVHTTPHDHAVAAPFAPLTPKITN